MSRKHAPMRVTLPGDLPEVYVCRFCNATTEVWLDSESFSKTEIAFDQECIRFGILTRLRAGFWNWRLKRNMRRVAREIKELK